MSTQAVRPHAPRPTPSLHEVSLSAPDWRPFALLLIDAQRDFWSESVAAAVPRFPESVARLLSLCRTTGADSDAYYFPDACAWWLDYASAGKISAEEQELICADRGRWLFLGLVVGQKAPGPVRHPGVAR